MLYKFVLDTAWGRGYTPVFQVVRSQFIDGGLGWPTRERTKDHDLDHTRIPHLLLNGVDELRSDY